MAATLSEIGAQAALKSLLGLSLRLHLYTNNRSPHVKDTAKNYVELYGAGYSPVDLDSSQWKISATDYHVEARYPKQSFSFTGPTGNVFGYFVTEAGSETLIWAERFRDGPYIAREADDTIDVHLVLAAA